jgi:hypothetical protein
VWSVWNFRKLLGGEVEISRKFWIVKQGRRNVREISGIEIIWGKQPPRPFTTTTFGIDNVQKRPFTTTVGIIPALFE